MPSLLVRRRSETGRGDPFQPAAIASTTPVGHGHRVNDAGRLIMTRHFDIFFSRAGEKEQTTSFLPQWPIRLIH
jgi:hypothetical protein